jgi:hypothetical protein
VIGDVAAARDVLFGHAACASVKKLFASTMQVQPGVTVHTSLPRVGVGFDTHTLPRRLFSLVDHRRVNNVHGQDT